MIEYEFGPVGVKKEIFVIKPYGGKPHFNVPTEIGANPFGAMTPYFLTVHKLAGAKYAVIRTASGGDDFN